MSLADIYNLAQDTTPGGFFSRVEAQLVASAISIANEVTADQQTISMGAVTAGTFTLNFLGQTTAAIQWNTSASALQAQLHLRDSFCLRHMAHHHLILGCPAHLGPAARGYPARGHGHTGGRTTSYSPDT